MGIKVHRKFSSILRENGHWLLLSAIMLLILIARIYHVAGYPYHEDEIGSIGVMQSIVSKGLPLTGGELYWRALLAHYLMAIPLFFVEVSPLSTRLVCLLMSVLLLPAIYRAGCSLHGKPAGFMAVCLLGVSAYENLFASFARFYLPQQFFFVWALVLAYLYLVEGDKAKGLWLFLALAGTLSTHNLGVLIWPPMGLAFLLGWRWSLLRSCKFIFALAVLLLETYVLDYWTPTSAFQNHFALSLKLGSMDDHLVFARLLSDMLPGGWAMMTLGFTALIFDRSRRKAWLFFCFAFLQTLLVVSFMAPGDNPRYMIQVFPLAILIGSAGVVWLAAICPPFAKLQSVSNIREYKGAAICIAVLATGLVGWQVDHYNLETSLGYGFRFVDQKPAHDFIAERLAPNDILISADPGISGFYLHRPVDHFLREKYDSTAKSYGPFPLDVKGASPGYYIDSTQQMIQVLRSAKGKVWLYANWKLEWAIGPELDEMVRRNFQLAFERGETWVLVRSPQKQLLY